EIDKQEILSKIVDLPISKWNYKKDKEKFAHIGPMAQDFYGAFQVGVSDKRISDVDTTGVAFAAIQALNEKLESKEKQIVEQANQIDELMGRLQRLESLVAAPQN
ncbi:MAG: tail fiber domain-containing protein, partial [Planctomycetota bacterium]